MPTTQDTRHVTIYQLELTQEELGILKEALDSHEYWQLSEPEDRDSGYVMLEDDDPRTSEEIRACRALLRKLEAI